VRASDAAGNTDATPGSYSWTITTGSTDTTPPETTITAAPPASTTATSASFSFTSSEAGSSFQCKLDAGSYGACTSPKSYSGLAVAGHTFSVKATDTAGNTDPTPAVFSWSVTGGSTSGPLETWITDGPLVKTTATSASFSFLSPKAGATFSCSLDGSAFVGCASPKSYSSLAAGRHTFEVRAQASSAVDNSPAAYGFQVGTALYSSAPAGRVRPWAPQWMGGARTLTQTQALADAKNFDLLIAHAGVYKNYVKAMEQANARLLVCVYMNATFTYRTDLAESAYAHDADGKRISPLEWPSTFMLSPDSPVAIQFKKSEGTELLRQSGYDGILLDVTGLSPLKLSYVSALAINPATGKVWTAEEWRAAVANLVDEIKSVTQPRPLVRNSLKNGPTYYAPSDPSSETLTPGFLGNMAETWLRESTASISSYPSESVWKQNVDMLGDAGSKGFSVFQVTKVWTSATTAQKDAWYKYTLASWLLGNDGRAFFHFTYANGDATTPRPFNRLDLGTASGAYAKASGVYQRSFSAGKVLVNPTSSTVTVGLGGSYKTLSGASVTSVTLGPNSAEILTS
jgi:hypothetical protein